MIDYFLSRLGLDPATVPSGDKRNGWLASRIVPAPTTTGHVLLCPRGSLPLRDMPRRSARAILRWGGRRGLAVTLHGTAPSLAALCGAVAGARAVVSTDTAMVHLADAFSVPCLGFFPTHRPEWRVRDSPLCRAVDLTTPALPPALEFARGPDDLAAARRAWFPHGHDLTWLRDALDAALA